MFFYSIKRALLMVPILLGITLLSFSVMHMAPGGPAEAQMEFSAKASAEARERLRKLYGADQPVHKQYLTWLKKFVTLDFGEAFADGRKVKDKILERLPITLTINLLSLFVVLLIAIPIGIMSATHQYSILDRATTMFVFVGYSMPHFWMALLLIYLFGVQWGVLPISGKESLDTTGFTTLQWLMDRAEHLVLPVFVSAIGGLAGFSRYMRNNMLEVMRQDYIRTARAKGLPENTVIYKHALRNALMPVITILGLSLPGIIGGSVIMETVFGIDGMGRLMFQAVFSRDYNVAMGILVPAAVLTMLGNFMADIGYALADPRVRLR
ncbi:MAG: ABC transporter permease [Nitrospirae bacterium]|nr:ABC transporter permease [Nitrospirota bacterium]NTW67705.1 ABC transporter permease [Nitrospirota bacterium]